MNTPKNHPTLHTPKTGLLLVNLGTPENTGYWALRRYLTEFLNDRRVIDLPRWLWWPILYGPVLTFRPFKIAKAYKAIWNKERNESPLKSITRAQAEGLQKKLPKNVLVGWAMRYGQPAIEKTIEKMLAAGCRDLKVLPLYPQYSASTTGTVCDAVFDTLKKRRWVPPLSIVPPYYDHPAYITALAGSVKTHLKTLPWKPEVLLASFHGMPVRYCRAGDPYYCHCHKTARLLAQALKYDFVTTGDLPAHAEGEPARTSATGPRLFLTFQSRFGPADWLQPYTDQTLEHLAKQGVKNVAVMTPGFAADCLETLEEIAIGGQEIFHTHGGENFTHIPSLNETKSSIDMLLTVLKG
jgi:ferrochelatase